MTILFFYSSIIGHLVITKVPGTSGRKGALPEIMSHKNFGFIFKWIVLCNMNKNLIRFTSFTAVQTKNYIHTKVVSVSWYRHIFYCHKLSTQPRFRCIPNHCNYWPLFMLVSQVNTSSYLHAPDFPESGAPATFIKLIQRDSASSRCQDQIESCRPIPPRLQCLSLCCRRTSTAQRTGRCWPAWPPAPTATSRLTARQPLKNTCAASWRWRTSSPWTGSDRSAAGLFPSFVGISD